MRTTIDNVHTLSCDSGLGHSYWAEAAAYSINTQNLIPSCRHPETIPTEAYSRGRDKTSLTFVCLDLSAGQKYPQHKGAPSLILRYASGSGNYRVQEVGSHYVFVSHDVVFEEGWPHHTLADIWEETSLTFNTFEMDIVLPADNGHNKQVLNQDQTDQHDIPIEPCWSTCVPQLTKVSLQSMEYQKC